MGGENKPGVEGRRHHQSLGLPHLVLQHFQAAACHPRTQAAPAPMDGSWHTQNSTAEHGMAPYGLRAKHPHPVSQSWPWGSCRPKVLETFAPWAAPTFIAVHP